MKGPNQNQKKESVIDMKKILKQKKITTYWKKKMIAATMAGVFIFSNLLTMTGCSAKVQAENLMDNITPQHIEVSQDLQKGNVAVSDFAVRLAQASQTEGESLLISPLSVLYALAMAANGAKEETLTQMEEVLGMTTEELNHYLYSYLQALQTNEKYKLSLANSIWFTSDSRFTVNQEFLQKNADYYGADIFRTPFDNSTFNDINTWVNDKTDGMIPEILNEIPQDAVMYLVNALAFEAEWESIYKKHQVHKGDFTTENGTKQKVEFMHSEENKYLEDENASGFIKYYKDRKYAFVALLPNEGVSVAEYLSDLTGEHLSELLANVKNDFLNVSIPKFETEYEVEMSEILSNMGMPDAFNGDAADFTGLGTSTDGNIFIDRVLHKTFISVGEQGTKAGAATVVEMNDEGAMLMPEPKEIYLDRPFVYMLIDCENNIPFFIGTMMNVE